MTSFLNNKYATSANMKQIAELCQEVYLFKTRQDKTIVSMQLRHENRKMRNKHHGEKKTKRNAIPWSQKREGKITD